MQLDPVVWADGCGVVLGGECGLELGSGSKLVHVARQAHGRD